MPNETEQQALKPSGRGGFGAVLRRALHRKTTWIVGVPLLLVLLAAGGFLGYMQYLNSNTPAPLSFADAPGPQGSTDATATAKASAAASPGAKASAAASPGAKALTAAVAAGPKGSAAHAAAGARASAVPAAAASGVDGRWLVGSNSIAGYRIGYSAGPTRGTRVGRNTAGDNAVTGEFKIAGNTLQSANFAVAMSKVKCDGGDACTTHINSIMDVANHPKETFVLSTPVDLHSIPADGKQITVSVTGKLTLRGVTRTVTFPLTARRNAGRIEVLGSIPVNRDDYKIPDSGEPGFNIDKNGQIELLLVFDHRA